MDLKAELVSKTEEINNMQRTLKYTKILELQQEIVILVEEGRRLNTKLT